METLQIAMIVVLSTGLLSVVGYTAIQTFSQGKRLIVIETKVDMLIAQMNLFIKTETDGLKEIISENTTALERIADR